LTAWARCVVLQANPRQVQRLIDLAVQQSDVQDWRRVAMLQGFPDPVKGHRARPIILEHEPRELMALYMTACEPLTSALDNAFDRVHWIGQSGFEPPPPPQPLSPEIQARFDAGKRVFAATCIQCHKATGLGQEGLAPPLVDSEWVLGPEQRATRIVI